MTIEEVVRQVPRDEHADVIRESVKAVAQELISGPGKSNPSFELTGTIDLVEGIDMPR